MTTRPALGELTVGQRVMVRRSSNDMTRRTSKDRYIPAKVVKAARVWVDLERVGDSWPKTWRMRRDTQNEGTQYSGSNASFATLEQHAWDKAREWAFEVLRDNGIELRHDSLWRHREIELAKILTSGQEGDGS